MSGSAMRTPIYRPQCDLDHKHRLTSRSRAGANDYDQVVNSGAAPQTVLGSIIRRQRELAELPMRQFAAAVGISNPYLSQIERGLRAPSETVLSAIADSLQTSADELYKQAGFVGTEPDDDAERADGLEAAIAAASELTAAQRKALTEIYRGFIDAKAVRRARKPRP
jgi:transcriptional regulator with XRE-family HTH domain